MAYRGWGSAVAYRADEDVWTAPASAPSIIPALPLHRGYSSPRTPDPSKQPPFPELDCIRHLLPPSVLAIAAHRAAEAGVGADRVLIAWGIISEDSYGRALASFLDAPFEPLIERPRDQCPLTDSQLVDAANNGMLPLIADSRLEFAVAPSLVDSRRLLPVATAGTDLTRRIRITSAARLRAFVARHCRRELDYKAADEFRAEHPELSAGVEQHHRIAIGIVLAATLVALIVAPGISITAIELVLGSIFLAWTGLRFLGLLSERLLRREPQTFSEDWLPVYSIIIALYREAAAVDELVTALRRLRYPMEKLDVKLVLEPDDHTTRDALARMQLGPPFEIVIAPSRGPRTKPKALNAALPYVRGKFVAVFDAEDRPEPDQLRLALEAFVAGDEKLACVQARLTIDNTGDSWLTRGIMAQTPQDLNPAHP